MPEGNPGSEQCTVNELVESIRAVVGHLLELHHHEMEAVKNWDIDAMERIDRELDRANAHRDSLLQRLNSYMKEHGRQEIPKSSRASSAPKKPRRPGPVSGAAELHDAAANG